MRKGDAITNQTESAASSNDVALFDVATIELLLSLLKSAIWA